MDDTGQSMKSGSVAQSVAYGWFEPHQRLMLFDWARNYSHSLELVGSMYRFKHDFTVELKLKMRACNCVKYPLYQKQLQNCTRFSLWQHDIKASTKFIIHFLNYIFSHDLCLKRVHRFL